MPATAAPTPQLTLAQTLASGLKRKQLPTHVDGIPVSVLLAPSAPQAPQDRPIASRKRVQVRPQLLNGLYS